MLTSLSLKSKVPKRKKLKCDELSTMPTYFGKLY